MDDLLAYDAIVFPADGRPPHLVPLMTSLTTRTDPLTGALIQSARIPHPEVYMDHIAEGLGSGAWRFQIVELLDGMNKNFENPYVIFYPVVSRDGSQFPVNKSIRDIIREVQGTNTGEDETKWRGNIVVAKYRLRAFADMMSATMADFPILKNYFATHGPETQV